MGAITKNFSKPKGLIGSVILNAMNKGHEKLTKWTLSLVDIHVGDKVLDVGCGGGNAIHLMSQKSDMVYGVDYSETSVKKAVKKNAAAIAEGKVDIRQASVSSLPFEDNMFDVITAFETIYFWPDLANDFKEVCRVVKSGGVFAAAFQVGDTEEHSRAMENRVEGMRVPNPEDVEQLLREAGFADVTIHQDALTSPEWLDICVIGKK